MIELVGTDNTLQDNSQQNLNLANNTLTNSLQQNAQLLQNDQQRLTQNIEALRQQNQAKLGSDMAIAQAEGNPNNGFTGLLSGLAQAGLQYLDYSKKKELSDYQIKVDEAVIQKKELAAKQAAQQDAKEAAVTQALGDIHTKYLAGGFKEGGLLVGAINYRNEAFDVLEKSGLTPEQVTKFSNVIYQNVKTQLDSDNTRITEQTDKIEKNRTSTILSGKLIEISPEISKIKANPTADINPTLEQLSTKINGILTDPNINLSDSDKYTLISSLWDEVQKAVGENQSARAQIVAQLEGARKYTIEASQITARYKSKLGTQEEIPRSVYEYQLFEARRRNGLPATLNDPDPFQAQKDYRTAQELSQALEQGQIDEISQEVNNIGTTNEQVGALTLLFMNNRSVLEQYKNDPIRSKIPGVRAAISLAEEHDRDFDRLSKIPGEKADLNLTIAKVQQNDTEWLIVQSKKGGVFGELFGGINKEDVTQWNAARSRYLEAANAKLRTLDEEAERIRSKYQPYGLDKPPEALKKEGPKRIEAVQTYINTQAQAAQKRAQESRNTRLGIQGNFNAGQGEGINSDYVIQDPDTGSIMFNSSTLTNINAFLTVSTPFSNDVTGGSARSKIILPFPAGTKNIALTRRDYREKRPTHIHAGEDIVVPSGTPITFYMQGRVVQKKFDKNGYGWYVTIKGADGPYHRFAHLSSTNVEVGDVVAPGNTIALSGNTGRSSGAHLHWEIRTNDGFKEQGTIDPIEYMSSQSVVVSNTKRPTGDTTNATYKGGNQPRVPNNATQLAGGFYIHNGRLGRINQPDRPLTDANKTFTPQNPAKTGYQSSMAPQQDMSDTHGYAYLANNAAMREAINKGAKELGIPGAVLADIINNETSFSPSKMQSAHGAGGQYVGIMGFGQDALDDISAQFKMPRITIHQLMKLPPEKQVPWMVKYFQLSYVKPHVQGKGAEYYAAAVLGGWSLARDLAKDKNKALNRRDSYGTTLREYLNRMGKPVGRKWQSSAVRIERLIATTHTGYHEGCKVCEQLRRSDSFVPHISQFA
ncbi:MULTISPECIES: peptidoglycan DD-metalloendopeptidase family protein [Calothrix]|uniref:Peptidoglycan DD-metalloendopeptidase family protein n=2 Tax=Calothrix TaxID=1186 RepID=A0ABR8AJC6_9CYAN|nr:MULTISPECIES: peptidoglycan DD-metalloendopeptidase family protein [Calothrix]MBD2200150.1 peptidoglycan DD-metalloendopeptidase family protein [Calothrix parietina FACHB-288]MBD2229140.1 peptidoglycan DD-metalloendopeptidase family protein [Calothrix anomala FACHB-343]